MATLIRSARKTFLSSSPFSQSLICSLERRHLAPAVRLRDSISTNLFQSRPYAAEAISKSPFEANILRILRNEIYYQSDYAPPHKPVTEFNSFAVEDRAGEQWMMMRGRFGNLEDIKIEATMYDGFVSVPRTGDDQIGEDVRLHISLIVDISRKDDSDALEFVCSAWPDSLEIHKIYLLSRDSVVARPYMGPDFRNLSGEFQKTFREFLAARGVNDELSVFLHEYMMNKDRIELLKWLRNVRSFIEK